MLHLIFESNIHAGIEKLSLKKAIFWLRAAELLNIRLSQIFLAKAIIKCSFNEPVPEKYRAMQLLLVLGAKPNSVTHLSHHKTPLEAAILKLDLAAVKLLVKAGADPLKILSLAVSHEVIDRKKQHLVADNPEKVAILEFLLSSSNLSGISKSFFAENKSVANAMYEAIENGEFLIGETCLRFGFKIDTPLSIYAYSGLVRAYRTDKREIAQWYIDHGAQPDSNHNSLVLWLEPEQGLE